MRAALERRGQRSFDGFAHTLGTDGARDDLERAVHRTGARQHQVPHLRPARSRFSGQVRCVDEGTAVNHDAVAGDRLAGTNQDAVPPFKILHGDGVLASIAQPRGRHLDRAGQFPHVLPGALLGVHVEPACQADQHQHHRDGLEVHLAAARDRVPDAHPERGTRTQDDQAIHRQEATLHAHTAGQGQPDPEQDRNAQQERRGTHESAQGLGALVGEAPVGSQVLAVQGQAGHHDAHRQERAEHDPRQPTVGGRCRRVLVGARAQRRDERAARAAVARSAPSPAHG